MDWCFGTALRIYGGEDAVRPLPHHALTKPTSDDGPVTSAAAQLSWEEYKEEREKARDLRRQQGSGTSFSLSSLFGRSSSAEGKAKKE